MTKVVTYLFDNMFQGNNKISNREKAIVVGLAALIIATTFLVIL